MIKILHVIICLDADGAELMLMRLIQSHQSNAQFRHTVISLTTIGEVGQQLLAMGVEVHALGMRSAFDVPRIFIQLVRFIRKSRPEIVQTWMYHADLLGGLTARLAGQRNVIWGVRTTDVKAAGLSVTVVVRKLCAWLSNWVPQTIVCVAEASRIAHVAIGYAADRMVVVPNGFDLAQLTATDIQRDAIRSEHMIGSHEVVIGTLGRFHPIKGQENFVRAAGIVARHIPDVRFLMVGRGCIAANAELASWIQQTGVVERFVLLGQRSDVPACLSAMDVFCLPSRTEGFPNAAAEAMAMGLPCVVTNVGDAALLVADTGVVVPKDNPQALADGIAYVLNMQPEQRAILGKKAQERIRTEFSIDRVRQRFEEVYRRVLLDGNGKN